MHKCLCIFMFYDCFTYGNFNFSYTKKQNIKEAKGKSNFHKKKNNKMKSYIILTIKNNDWNYDVWAFLTRIFLTLENRSGCRCCLAREKSLFKKRFFTRGTLRYDVMPRLSRFRAIYALWRVKGEEESILKG